MAYQVMPEAGVGTWPPRVPPAPAVPRVEFLAGCDLGQAADFSAFVVVERTQEAAAAAAYQVRHIERWPLRTPYTAIAQDVLARMQRPPLTEARLALDVTGVGAAVADLLAVEPLRPRLARILITAGAEATEPERQVYHVPKRDLVGCVQVLLQGQRLTIVRALPEAATLTKELGDFQMKLTAAAHDVYGAWREGTHDDVLLAVACACWLGERPLRLPQVF